MYNYAMNTFNSGQVRVLIYRDKAEGVWYGTALEFNLTVDGDDKNTIMLELDRAMRDYVRSASEIGSVDILNQDPDPELVALWDAHMTTTAVESPYTPYFAGRESIVHA